MFKPLYAYKLIRKDEIVLAVPSMQYGIASYELNALCAQGFIIYCEITASTPVRAVEIFKENEKLEINKLKQELFHLHTKYNEIQRENENLRCESSLSRKSNNSVKYYEIFGFSNPPNPDDLKKRYRFLRQRLHPDKGGDTQLFQLIQQVYEQLEKA